MAAAGSASYSSGTFTVLGSGADIWNTADAFQFVSQTVSGNCTIIAKVNSVSNTNSWAKACVMIRDSSNASAANAAMAIAAGGDCAFITRTPDGASSTDSVAVLGAPGWVKLVRSGTSFTGYYSSDGSTWTQIGSSVTISGMPTSAVVGLGVTSHDDGVLCTGVFSNVSVTTP